MLRVRFCCRAVSLLLVITLLPVLHGGFAAPAVTPADQASAGEIGSRHILILSSYHRDYSWTEQIIEGIHAAFAEFDTPIEFSYEYLDTKRQEETAAYYQLCAELLLHKYQRKPVDLIILSDNSSFNFLAVHQQQLFPDVPVVFCGINNYSPTLHSRLPGSTGVAEDKEMGATLGLIRRLHPDARSIAIISDTTGTGAIDAGLIKHAIKEDSSFAPVILSSGQLSLAELLERLRHLPADTIIFFSSFWHDRTGRTFAADDVIPLLAKNASVPIYTHADTFLSGGIVGGVLVHGHTQGRRAGEMAVQILNGVPIASIPVSAHANKPIFDYQALVRWQIDKQRLPADAVILNLPPPSFYERYTALIWSTIATFITLLLLIIGLAANIVFRQRAEAALRQSEARFRALIEMSPLPILLCHGNDILYANRTFMELVNADCFEAVTVRQLFDFVATDEVDRVKHTVATWVQSGRQGALQFESIGRRMDGSHFPVAVNVTMITLAEGACSLAFISDITERCRAEEERHKLQTQLLHAQKMESVGRLAGGVAHDFNNMLGVILGYTELSMKQLAPSERLYANLQQIKEAAEHSADLTRQLLAFARRQTVAPKVIDLNDTVERMLQMLHRLIGEQIKLSWLPGNAVWPVRIDPVQLQQVLMNLCVNARDAISGAGTVIIETGNLAGSSALLGQQGDIVPGDYVQLAVGDDGCGIDAQTREHLFDPFFTTKEIGKGTGLGLAMVYGIVKQNDGHIIVQSSPGQGTVFHILLPRHDAAIEPAVEKQPPEPAAAISGQETILLVEDEPKILEMTATLLELQGYRVISAPLPSEAIRLAEKHHGEIHLLITDVIMPEMNGRELAEHLLASYPNLKQLFISGYTADIMSANGGPDDEIHFLQKPFTAAELSSAVQKATGSGLVF